MRKKQAKSERNDQTIYLRIERETLATIDAVAKRESRSRSSQVTHILKQFVREMGACGR
jgi:hypothetical protein